MTSKSFFNKLGSKLLLALTIVCLLCCSLFCLTACKESEQTNTKDPTYSYTETDDGLINNRNFTYGTSDTKLTSYPKTSPNGWTRSTDSSVSSSYVNSGVIDVSDEGWKELLNTLYKDNEFLSYAKEKFGFTTDSVKDEIKAEKNDTSYSPTDDEVKTAILKKLETNFTKPDMTGASDTKVYMLNNYSKDVKDLGVGTSQKVTSASSIALNKGEYGKFTVKVRTLNLASINNTDFGANIRLINTFNGTSQAEYKITNIKNTDWTTYTVYVKADDMFDCKVTLVLGLGNGETQMTEGTAFFDEIDFVHMTASEYATEINGKTVEAKTFNFAGKDAIEVNAVANTVYLYNMNFNDYLTANATIADKFDITELTNSNLSGAFTATKTGTAGGDKLNSTAVTPAFTDADITVFPYTSKTAKVEVTKQSYTLSLNNEFTVGAKSYSVVSFFVKNSLSKFSNTNVTVDLFDILGTTIEKRPAVVTISDANGEWTKYTLTVNNNFDSDRKFKLDFVVGPTDVASATTEVDFATGTVEITSPVVYSGKIDKEDNSYNDNNLYDIYTLLNSGANGTTSLYAGFSKDATEDNSTKTYALTTAPGDIGAIKDRPAQPANYKGVTSNHIYIKDDGTDRAITTRVNGDANGSYAGLVNTEYTYTGFDIASALNGLYTTDNHLQPLMIYNNVSDSYGFIGNTNTIATSAYAKVSVTLKVVDFSATEKATAFVYLVNVADKHKEVMTFENFTVNTDGENTISNGAEYKAEDHPMMLEVNSSMMNDDGWVTVEFYVASGATAKEFRVEIWNGSRDAVTKSKGYVFINSITVSTSGAFNEPAKWTEAFTVSGNPLFGKAFGDDQELIMYQRVLTDTEIEYNADPETTSTVSYSPNYVWAKTETMIYAIFNTIDPVEVDPYANEQTEEETESGCTAKTDPSTFWLSFSSIALGVVLVLAIVMLFVKNIRRRRKANASDAKSHYKVTSRSRVQKKTTEKVTKAKEEVIEDELIEELESEEPAVEENLDTYVYGEVQDFGTNEESTTEESSNEQVSDSDEVKPE